MRQLIILFVILLSIGIVTGVAQKYLPTLGKQTESLKLPLGQEKVKVVTEESITIDIVKKQGPAVVTIAEDIPQSSSRSLFGLQAPQQDTQNEPQSIGSGFVISSDGLIVTNKHVVSQTQGTYYIITSNDKKYTVQQIYRDPSNDVAILKINPSENHEKLTTIVMGDSSNLQVGQYVIAIGTALGEFRNTVTTGVISGLGRGITAGSSFSGDAEQLDDVVQTDAAINPGNSGGPLLNSSGQVIGVNTAVSGNGENIGFAIPINAIKDSLKTFNETGKFERAYLGVAYKVISRDVALLNDVPEGVYVQQVVSGSPAEKAGIQSGDIITKIEGQRLSDTVTLSSLIGKKKIGDSISITVYRDNTSLDVTAKLENGTDQ